MAVLGHDLRYQLAALAAGTRLLKHELLSDKRKSVFSMMENSTLRMSPLIEDVIDLARTRLGGGIPLSLSKEPLEPVLQQVAQEMRTLHPNRAIETEFDLAKKIFADRDRIGRVLLNLLGNAPTYSPADTPVMVRALTCGSFSLSVTNQGPEIPPTTLSKLLCLSRAAMVKKTRKALD